MDESFQHNRGGHWIIWHPQSKYTAPSAALGFRPIRLFENILPFY